MAVYKVPQDVEADDKLIGPFSFRQFIYLIIVAGAGFIGWMLYQLFLPLVIVVIPVILLFGALALPLRKDQPMETYLAAIISFYLKPHRRLWSPDGSQALVEITAPVVVEVKRTKDLSEDEAEQRLSYLAQIVDSRGWAVRGVQGQTTADSSALTNDAFYAAQSAPDILDESTGLGQALETRLDQTDARRHQAMLEQFRAQSASAAAQPQQAVPQAPQMQQPVTPMAQQAPQAPLMPAPAPQTPPVANPYSAIPNPAPAADDPKVTFNPYPNMHQSIINPVGATPVEPQTPPIPQPEPEKPSEKQLSPDIINLANNSDLSVETIAREANRIHEKEKISEDEVVISLR